MKIPSDRASLALGCGVIVDPFHVSGEVYNQIKIKSKSRYSLQICEIHIVFRGKQCCFSVRPVLFSL